MTSGQHLDLDELILYCMGTPDAETNERVRNHLQECDECGAQATSLCSDMALTAMAVPQVNPPSGAKDRLFRAAGLDPVQHTPFLATQDVPDESVSPSEKVVPLKTRRYSPVLIWGGWVAAVACLFYAVHVREINRGMRQQLRMETAQIMQSNRDAARARKVLDVLTSPHAQRVTLVAAHAKPEPSGHAVYLADRGALVFTASNLAPLPPDKTYELWVIPANGTAPVPAGTFQPDARGMASLLLPDIPEGINAKAFGVTMENTGGASKPTMPILLAGG